MNETGRFITIEGIEGVGKSTNLDFVLGYLRAAGLSVLQTREPGGTPAAERIREILIAADGESMPDVAELLLMFAARSLHVENKIRPALANGQWVVCDRFTDATWAYQGGGRGLRLDQIEALANWVHGDLQPDLTLLLDAPVDLAARRVYGRGAADRIELEKETFFARVREVYLRRAEAEPGRFVIVDASQDLADVQSDIETVLAATVPRK